MINKILYERYILELGVRVLSVSHKPMVLDLLLLVPGPKLRLTMKFLDVEEQLG